MTAVTERQKKRQNWMSVLAKSQHAELMTRWESLSLNPEYAMVRQPEIGLAQVRARMGSTGRQFNIGDTTITRAVVKLSTGELGYSYLQGRNKQHAEVAAVIDALMQTSTHQQALQEQLIDPLAALKQESESMRAKEVATSKVDFFTLVRGED
ncbi:phosphonate C-P lyase system protein PhnG [Vibrio amylolyticus]|uniref:phosphonate C-P lyase system protein PhnG n=1 Tax=Vibrio amylolyticus TaxID=2847292 RepID=UPI00354B5B84